ncbi:hypothetical protein CCHL11_04806 [Colletotrichum chlorophyti]|uniref:Uncharacterized protein n=1 Tax=Colletotrichum chlorophyti TaxID=708187 RepID=A0A1Q8S1M1_9PEZI|nr:hypothetical protein CCHL11_04806 [Colletotrichum chlorophyti]
MSSFGRSFSAASPVMALPPQPAHQASFGMEPYTQAAPFGHPAAFQRCAAPSALPATNPRVAGRKRSRDEAAPNLVTDEPEPHSKPQEPEDEWEYGPGMVLIKKGGYVADASSQSGTWVEEKAAQDQVRKTKEAIKRLHDQQQRPSLRSNKSQRLDQNTMPSLGTINRPALVARSDTLPLDNPSQPVVDQFTLHLGIGWRRISEDEHIQAAARGWARYIENHYPVSSVVIQLESKGLQSYLVEAAEGFFLFSEDLRQGRLVSKDVEDAMSNLKCSPPRFDGQETMLATESPAASESTNATLVLDVDSHMEM